MEQQHDKSSMFSEFCMILNAMTFIIPTNWWILFANQFNGRLVDSLGIQFHGKELSLTQSVSWCGTGHSLIHRVVSIHDSTSQKVLVNGGILQDSSEKDIQDIERHLISDTRFSTSKRFNGKSKALKFWFIWTSNFMSRLSCWFQNATHFSPVLKRQKWISFSS
jgi:hypothetical protein